MATRSGASEDAREPLAASGDELVLLETLRPVRDPTEECG